MNPYLSKHPYYLIYQEEMAVLKQRRSETYIKKEELSAEAQEVWDYKRELQENHLHTPYIQSNYKVGNPYAWTETD